MFILCEIAVHDIVSRKLRFRESTDKQFFCLNFTTENPQLFKQNTHGWIRGFKVHIF